MKSEGDIFLIKISLPKLSKISITQYEAGYFQGEKEGLLTSCWHLISLHCGWSTCSGRKVCKPILRLKCSFICVKHCEGAGCVSSSVISNVIYNNVKITDIRDLPPDIKEELKAWGFSPLHRNQPQGSWCSFLWSSCALPRLYRELCFRRVTGTLLGSPGSL